MLRSPQLRAFVRAAAFYSLLGPVYGAPPGRGWTIAWNDEFEGASLDSSKWGHWLLGARRQAINTASAVSVGGGVLTISTATISGTHYTGMVATDGKYLPAYGYMEARIAYDSTPGMWSAFWLQSPTMGNPIGDPQGAGTEVDVCEHRKVDAGGASIENRIVMNIHWDGYGASHQSIGADSGNRGLASGYHLYGLEWTPTVQRVYIDGQLAWTVTNPVSQRSEFIILSSEVQGGIWAGVIPAGGYGSWTSTTTKMKVDYVRIYQRNEALLNSSVEARLAPWKSFGSVNHVAGVGRGSSKALRLQRNDVQAESRAEQAVFGLLPNTEYVVSGWGNSGASWWPAVYIGAKNHGGPQVEDAVSTNGYSRAEAWFITGQANSSATIFARMPTVWGNCLVDDFRLRRAAAVHNPGFETGELGNFWTSVYGATDIAASDMRTGARCLRFNGSAGLASGAEQDAEGLLPNTTYELSAWTRNSWQGTRIGAKNYGGADTWDEVSADTAYSRGTVAFTTRASNTSARIYAFFPRTDGWNFSYVDDFFLCQPLSAPWEKADIGGGASGTSGFRNGALVQQARGGDIWGNADTFHYTYQTLTGNGYILARVRTLQALDGNAKLGVMLRESLDADAKHVTLNWTPGRRVQWIRRADTGGSSVSTNVPDVDLAPWLYIGRQGNLLTAYLSLDAADWTPVGDPIEMPMAPALHAGIAVTPRVVSELAESSLDNLYIVADDSDQDGLLDSWEWNYFGGLDQGPYDDPDGDGYDNATEYAYGWSPLEPN